MENLSQVTDKLYHRILYRVHSAWMGFELTMLANSTFYWSACTNPGLSERSCIYVFRSIILSLFLSFFYYILELFWFLSFYSNYTIYIILIQHYVILFVSDLRQVGGFLRVFQFSASIKLTESDVKHRNPNPNTCQTVNNLQIVITMTVTLP